MLYAATSPDLCWWCGARAADRREYKLKRSDLARQFGPGPYPELVSQKDGRLRNVQGPNSRLAKATKKGLAEGSMWLGDVYVSQTDAEDRALILESHYGYRWFRVAWAVGSNLEGYPWPFRRAGPKPPHGPEPPRNVEVLLPKTAFLSTRSS